MFYFSKLVYDNKIGVVGYSFVKGIAKIVDCDTKYKAGTWLSRFIVVELSILIYYGKEAIIQENTKCLWSKFLQ